MVGYTVDRHAFDRAVFDRTGGHVTRYFERKGPKVAQLARQKASVYSPLVDPSRHTGALANSIDWEITGGITDRGLSVYADSPYAEGVHEGWGARIITVVSAEHLRFWWEREGVPFKGKMVSHPGGSANPFLRDALNETFARDL